MCLTLLSRGVERSGSVCSAEQLKVNDCMQAKGDAQAGEGQSWLENAVTCYLQAIRHGSAEGRGMMARILNLLSFHDTNGLVSKAIRKHGRQVSPSSILGHARHALSTSHQVLRHSSKS